MGLNAGAGRIQWARDQLMTKKAKRVKSLPILDESKKYGTGGFVDESLPDSTIVYLQNLSNLFGDSLLEWFRQRIGRYRAFQYMAENQPTKSEELKAIDQAISYLMETMKRLKHLPPSADAFVNEACWRRHKRFFHGWDGLLGEMHALVKETDILLALAWQQIDKHPSKSGNKPEHNRDSLLTDIADYLIKHSTSPIKKRQAAEISRDLLNTVAISVPDDIGEVEKLIRKFKKSRGK